MPRLPSSARRPTSVFSPSTGVWSSFQSPGVEHPAGLGLITTTAIESGNRVRHPHELEAEGADLLGGAVRLDLDELAWRARARARRASTSRARASAGWRAPSRPRPREGRTGAHRRGPRARASARSPGRACSTRYEKSGRTRSTPKCSSRGNARPASTTIRSSPISNTVMFFPTSPSPPSGMIRSAVATDGVYGRGSTALSEATRRRG